MKEKHHKFDFIKIKNFCSLKYTAKTMNKTVTSQYRMF